jgi:hypothetical protein
MYELGHGETGTRLIASPFPLAAFAYIFLNRSRAP